MHQELDVAEKEEENGNADEGKERRRKYFQRYIYRQNYREALRSLLWEPYECRGRGAGGARGGRAKRTLPESRSGSDSELESECSGSSRSSSPTSSRSCGNSVRGTPSAGSVSPREEIETRCSADPVREVMDGAALVSDLDPQDGVDSGSGEDRATALSAAHDDEDAILASASQCSVGAREDGPHVVPVRDGWSPPVGRMLVTVEGTLEPRDSGEDTRLVSPETSLDGPISVTPRNEQATPSGSNNVSVVNCYRAVPVAVVSTVPTIKCLNTQESATGQKNRRRQPGTRTRTNPRPSTLEDRPTGEPSGLTVHERSASNPVLGGETAGTQQSQQQQPPPPPPARTFISTEAQTDDLPQTVRSSNREQRRRERRERRHQRRLHQSVLSGAWPANADNARGLPDILNSHMPPPYTAVPPGLQMPPSGLQVPGSGLHVGGVQPGLPPHLMESPPGSPPSRHGGGRFPFPFPGSGRRRSRGQLYAHEEETPKSCCGMVVTQTVSIRWFIVMIAFVGICCVIVGTVLGAMKASGREHLTVSLLMIGVGIVLVTVSGVAWRLTSQDSPSCRSMLGFGSGHDSATEPNRRFVPRMPPSYGRPHHPYAAMMYPEFQYRPPPPSYHASMQEYRLRLLLLERTNGGAAGLQTAMSPPPTYRSHIGNVSSLRPPPLCRSLPQSEYSHPPSYRSRTSSTRPTLDPTAGSVAHSRDPSLISHVSDQNGNVTQAVVNVISVMGNTVDLHQTETDIQIDSIKLGVDEEVPIPPLRMILNKGKRSPTSSSEEAKPENVNLVTIVTVSDSSAATVRERPVESGILAHL